MATLVCISDPYLRSSVRSQIRTFLGFTETTYSSWTFVYCQGLWWGGGGRRQEQMPSPNYLKIFEFHQDKWLKM